MTKLSADPPAFQGFILASTQVATSLCTAFTTALQGSGCILTTALALRVLQGICIGLGGFMLKNIAASIGPAAYTPKGIPKEIQKSSQPTAFLRKARIIQGRRISLKS